MMRRIVEGFGCLEGRSAASSVAPRSIAAEATVTARRATLTSASFWWRRLVRWLYGSLAGILDFTRGDKIELSKAVFTKLVLGVWSVVVVVLLP